MFVTRLQSTSDPIHSQLEKQFHPKSPRRFWHFPSSSTSSTPSPPSPEVNLHLGSSNSLARGAKHVKSPSAGTIDLRAPAQFVHDSNTSVTVVRRPSEAVRGMRKPGICIPPSPTHLEHSEVKEGMNKRVTIISTSPIISPGPPQLPQIYTQPINVPMPGPAPVRISLQVTEPTPTDDDVPLFPVIASTLSKDQSEKGPTPPLKVRPRSPGLTSPINRPVGPRPSSPSSSITTTKPARPSRPLMDQDDRRNTVRPPPKLPLPPIPFTATILEITSRTVPVVSQQPILGGMNARHCSKRRKNHIVVTLEFAYSTESPLRNESVKIPLEDLRQGGGNGHLVQFVENAVKSFHDDKSQSRSPSEVAHRRLFQEKKKSGEQAKIIPTEDDDVTLARNSLSEESIISKPDMTDGESGSESDSDLDSEFDLEALLRDEYLKSLYIPRPTSSQPIPFSNDDLSNYLPPPPTLPFAKPFHLELGTSHTETVSILTTRSRKRAQLRNQYIQQERFPSPASSFTGSTSLKSRTQDKGPIQVRRGEKVKQLELNLVSEEEEIENDEPQEFFYIQPLQAEGMRYHNDQSKSKQLLPTSTLIEIRIFLLRDAATYHTLVQRLISGIFTNVGNMSEKTRKKVEDEARWLGMNRLVEELVGVSRERREGRTKGGDGYI